jgi:hypothetical protein
MGGNPHEMKKQQTYGVKLVLDPFCLGKRDGHLALAVMNRFKHHIVYDI